MAGVDDHRSNHGVFVSNGNSDHLKMNTLGNGNIGDGIVSSTASENEMLLKPAHPADDGKDGSCADGDDTAKNTSSDDDDDFEIVSLEEERPPAVQTDAAPIPEEPRATPPRLQEEQNDRSASAHVREKQSVVVVNNDCREELSRFFLREKHASPTTKPQTHSDIVASPSHPHHHPQRSLRPLLLQVPPHTPLLLDVAATFPVIAHIHPSSPLRDHVRLGDVLVYIDGKNSVQWSFEALTRRLNSDAFGADGVERTHKTKRKRETKEMGSVDGNGEEAAEEKKKAAMEGGCRTLIVLPKEQFRQRPRRRSRKKTARKEDRENSGLVTPAKDRHPDGIAPCIATPTTTTTTSATNTTSITTAPIAAITAIATTNKVTPDDEDDDDIENPHGQDPTTIAKQTNVVVVAPTSLPSATSDNITADDGKETHFQTKAASATITGDTENQEPMSEVESVRNSLELSNPMAVTEVDGNGNSNGLGEEGCRDDDEIDDEDEVEIIDENVRHDVHIPTTDPPSATNKPSTPPEQEEEEEEREYETLKRLVLRLQSQASTLTPHQRRIYEESYELLKERDRELRRNRPPVDIDVIAIRRRGDGCVSLRIRDRDDVDDSEDGEEDEEFSVEEVSTIYGGKWNPALFSASPRRLEDVWGYDVEEGYGYGGFHHRHHHHHHDDGNRYLTLDQGDASDNAPSHQNLKHHRHDIPHPNILGLLHPAIHRYRFDADARDALLQQQDEEVRRMALESLKRQQKRVEGFFVSLMFAAVGALIVILVMVFWAKD